MTFEFTTQTTLSHLLPLTPMSKKRDCKDHQIYSKKLRKICEKEVKFQFYQSHKNSSFDQHFLYTDIYGPNLSKNSLMTIS